MGLFINFLLFHLNTTYMRRKVSGQTLLKVSIKIRYSMYWKVTYSITSLTFGLIREAIKKYNQSNCGYFPNNAIFYFLIYKVHITPNEVSKFQFLMNIGQILSF